jgi:hypothetical protein
VNKFILLAAFLFITLQFLAGTMENRVDARISENVAPLIAGPQYAEQSGSGGSFISNKLNSLVGGVVTFLAFPKKIWDLAMKWIRWDYSFLDGSYAPFRIIVLYPISLGMIFGIFIPAIGRIT